MSANTHIFSTDLVYDVIKEGDVEKLVDIWYSSLAQKNGEETRNFIEQQLPQLAQRLFLPATNSFREFVESYDALYLTELLKSDDGRVEVLSRLRNSLGTYYAHLYDQNLNIPSSRVLVKIIFEIIKRIGVTENIAQILQGGKSMTLDPSLDFRLVLTPKTLIFFLGRKIRRKQDVLTFVRIVQDLAEKQALIALIIQHCVYPSGVVTKASTASQKDFVSKVIETTSDAKAINILRKEFLSFPFVQNNLELGKKVWNWRLD